MCQDEWILPRGIELRVETVSQKDELYTHIVLSNLKYSKDDEFS